MCWESHSWKNCGRSSGRFASAICKCPVSVRLDEGQRVFGGENETKLASLASSFRNKPSRARMAVIISTTRRSRRSSSRIWIPRSRLRSPHQTLRPSFLRKRHFSSSWSASSKRSTPFISRKSKNSSSASCICPKSSSARARCISKHLQRLSSCSCRTWRSCRYLIIVSHFAHEVEIR